MTIENFTEIKKGPRYRLELTDSEKQASNAAQPAPTAYNSRQVILQVNRTRKQDRNLGTIRIKISLALNAPTMIRNEINTGSYGGNIDQNRITQSSENIQA